mmetsp:Transcript_7751/g.22948  ORF Transcript_7751/g.22948 Transcript_7751/m.22948 type:complete len:266 (-) Transcript_7751:983-1780(-)
MSRRVRGSSEVVTADLDAGAPGRSVQPEYCPAAIYTAWVRSGHHQQGGVRGGGGPRGGAPGGAHRPARPHGRLRPQGSRAGRGDVRAGAAVRWPQGLRGAVGQLRAHRGPRHRRYGGGAGAGRQRGSQLRVPGAVRHPRARRHLPGGGHSAGPVLQPAPVRWGVRAHLQHRGGRAQPGAAAQDAGGGHRGRPGRLQGPPAGGHGDHPAPVRPGQEEAAPQMRAPQAAQLRDQHTGDGGAHLRGRPAGVVPLHALQACGEQPVHLC